MAAKARLRGQELHGLEDFWSAPSLTLPLNLLLGIGSVSASEMAISVPMAACTALVPCSKTLRILHVFPGVPGRRARLKEGTANFPFDSTPSLNFSELWPGAISLRAEAPPAPIPRPPRASERTPRTSQKQDREGRAGAGLQGSISMAMAPAVAGKKIKGPVPLRTPKAKISNKQEARSSSSALSSHSSASLSA